MQRPGLRPATSPVTTVAVEASAERAVVRDVAVAGSEPPGGARSESAAALLIGPLPCINCGAIVSWWRYDGMYRLREGDTYGPAHRCR